MEDLISRQAVDDVMYDYSRSHDVSYAQIMELIDQIPSVENKGEWIESKERSKHWYCSVCGGIHTDPETGKWREIFDYKYPFCPNCGADMRGKE